LGQLIHDAKAARIKVGVKLVSSEGIGTIAVALPKPARTSSTLPATPAALALRP